MSGESRRYPSLSGYGLISDCHSAALVSGGGSIDWCCMPRFDSGSFFGRLLDWDRGGHCTIAPAATADATHQRYEEDSMVLVTTFSTSGGELVVRDLFAMPSSDHADPRRDLIRVARVSRGQVDVRIEIVPRFDYASVRPGIRSHGQGVFTATGGDDGLLIWSDASLAIGDHYDLWATVPLREGEGIRLLLRSALPEELDPHPTESPAADGIDRALRRTVKWWRDWARASDHAAASAGVRRSAMVLKALTYTPTGAMLGAPTTSLPERVGGPANWDYRYSWVRDSTLCARSLADLGHVEEADAFRRFIQRSAAGHADDLQVMYGAGGERRLIEQELDGLEGYRRSRPVRVGNAAVGQLQLDTYGELVNLFWRWHRRGHSPDDDDWLFVVDLVETAIRRWREPDYGIWEVRGRPRHFVHSKALCWSAADRGLALARECMRRAPTTRWRKARAEIRRAIETRGYDKRRGVFVQAFGTSALDAATLLLPTFGFCRWDDERMVRTADAIRDRLADRGLVYRKRTRNHPSEGAFVACTFWLAEVYARQGRLAEARETFDRAVAGANELGLMSEQLDPRTGSPLGNYPQSLSHLSHIAAALALEECGGAGA